MKIAMAAQMHALEAAAIAAGALTACTLTENAGRAVGRAALSYLSGKHEGKAIVFCGTGGNGGDGLAAARFLHASGFEVRAILIGKRENLTATTRAMEAAFATSGGKLEEFTPDHADFAAWCLSCDVMVDAIFGLGLSRRVEGDALTAIHMMNTCHIPVVSADLASGVEADTGRVLGAAVDAARTVTFTLPKVGHYVGQGGLCRGELTVAEVGIPQNLVWELDSGVQSVESDDISLPHRARDAYKNSFGKVYILGGSVGYTGAPIFAAKAAVRTGAGLVYLGVPAPMWSVAAMKLDVAMPHPLPAGKEGMISVEATEEALHRIEACDVCLVGPGIGVGNGVQSVVRYILRSTHLPIVLDADGINALAGHIDILDARRGFFTVLTPHEGEFARLGGDLSSGDRLAVARAFAAEHGCALVLKGHCTITAFPDGTAYVSTTGNPGMAKGGSGDVLGGIILSLLGQGLTAREAIPTAVYLHGLAGDLSAQEKGEYGMTPNDMIERLPYILREY